MLNENQKKCFIPLEIAKGRCNCYENGNCKAERPQFQDAWVGDKQLYITCWYAGIKVNFEE